MAKPREQASTRTKRETKVRTTADSRFYFREDIMEMMDCKENKAYKIIRELNDELKAQGFLTYDGRVPKTYFEQRYGLTAIPINKGA